MDDRAEGAEIDHIDRNVAGIIAMAMDAGIPLDLDVGINTELFKDFVAGNDNFLFLDENCRMAINTQVAFAVFDLRGVMLVDRSEKRLYAKFHLGVSVLLLLLLAMFVTGIIIGLIMLADDSHDGPVLDVMFGNKVYVSVWIAPVLLSLLLNAFYRTTRYTLEKIQYIYEADDNTMLDKLADRTKACWLKGLE